VGEQLSSSQEGLCCTWCQSVSYSYSKHI